MTVSSPPAQRIQLTAELVHRHQAMVWRFLRLLGAEPGLADELAQEAFVRLWQHPPEDRGEAALAAWLRRTAQNLLSNSRRRRGGLVFDDAAIDAAWAGYERDDDGADFRAALAACLQALPAREQQALQLRYAAGGSRAAVAAAMRLGDEGVKSMLRRARARLQACVQRRLEEA